MNKEKICLLVDSSFYPDQEGPSTIHVLFSELLARTGYKVYVVHFVKSRTLLNFLQYQIYKISSGIHVLNNDYDLIITPLWLDQTASRYLLRFLARKPYILMIHGSDLFQSVLPGLNKKGLIFKLYGVFLESSSKMIINGASGVISTLEVFTYLDSLHVDKRKYRSLGFFYQNFDYRATESDHPWIKDDNYHILFYGRFHESKGLLYLINAMPQIVKHSNKVKLHLVGDGPLENEARKIVSENNLSNYVVFHGRIPHERVVSFIMASDCVVNPITWGAGVGTVALEVLSQRKPLILGDANVTIESLHKKYGCFLLIKPYDVDDIVEKVMLVMDNPSFASTIRAKIDRFVSEEYDEVNIGIKLEKTIEESIKYYQDNIR